MKKLLPIIAIALLNLTACKETDDAKNVATNEEMRKELKQLYPSLQRAHIGVEVHEFKDVKITLGDAELFAEPDTKKEEIAKHIAEMTYNMYHENNYLDKGTIIFTPVEDRMYNSSDPVKEYDMHLDELAKAHK